MRIGFVLECTPQGPDADIYPYVTRKICPGLTISKPETLRNKQNVMNEGPLVALTLLETGCDYVFIIWDRMPRWGGTGRCTEHKAQLEAGLAQFGVDQSRVFLCCIDEMLESWIVADGRGITAYFQSLTTHNVGTFADCKKPSQQTSPKERIERFNGRYNDFTDDFKIVKCMPEFNRPAQRNASFRHFKESVEQICVEQLTAAERLTSLFQKMGK